MDIRYLTGLGQKEFAASLRFKARTEPDPSQTRPFRFPERHRCESGRGVPCEGKSLRRHSFPPYDRQRSEYAAWRSALSWERRCAVRAQRSFEFRDTLLCPRAGQYAEGRLQDSSDRLALPKADEVGEVLPEVEQRESPAARQAGRAAPLEIVPCHHMGWKVHTLSG